MSSCKYDEVPAPKMSTEESLEFNLLEYMAGGFDTKRLKPEVKAVLDEAEGYLTDDEEFPEELLEQWRNIGGIYL